MNRENISLNISAEKENVTNVHKYKQVLIHIDTTGFGKEADIIKISALSGTDNFLTFITPSRNISPHASKNNHFKVINRKLCFHKQPVEEGPQEQQLIMLQKWLQKFETPVVLVGHNCKSFIAPSLMHDLKKHGLEEGFRSIVVGFIDSLKLSRTVFRDQKEHTLKSLAENIVGCPFDEEAHSGLEHVQLLQKVMVKALGELRTAGNLDEFSFSFSYAVNKADHSVSSKRTANSKARPVLKPAKRKC